MRKNSITTGLSLALIASLAFPAALTIYMARNIAIDAETTRVRAYAQDILTRSEAVTDQIDAAIKTLVAARSSTPCSMSHQALMRQIDLSSLYIQAIGHVEGDRMICSSLGTEIDLGPADIVRPSGVKIRIEVEFPFAKGTKFLVIERDGYAAIVHKDAPIDVATNIKNISVVTFSLPESRVFASRGILKKQWMELPGKDDKVSVNRDFVVAVVKSKRYLFGAVSALPIEELDKRIVSTAITLAPAGIAGSLIFICIALYLFRLRTAMPSVIKSALRRKEFFVEYQPVVELATGKWIGAEALIRWRRMDGEIVRPDIFIPVAEDSGLIRHVTRYVVDQIASEAPELFRRYQDFHIGINLAAADLHDKATVGMLLGLVTTTGAQPRNIFIEATERSFTDHELASGVIDELRLQGFHVAIDDFGTGYSSLAYLERIKLDYLKIDRSFVSTLNTNTATSEVVLHIIGMAKDLKLEMIAEGVETEAQAQFLRERGVRYAQGWLFAKSMPFHELLAGLENSANGMGALP